jgi:protoporphyrinogen oxidase
LFGSGSGHVPRFLILGGGPTGLGAARQLERNGCNSWALVESAAHAGGLASSFVDDHGFTWDIGGHVQFSHYDYVDQAMDEFLGVDGWLRHVRESWVWMRGRFIPYPLQNNVHRLPADELFRCLEGFVDITRSPRPRPKNFAQWIEANFGAGLAEIFLRPYNIKTWAYPPETMSATWVGERVAVSNLCRVLKNLVFDLDDYSWGPNNTFSFPKKGGTGAIWAACAAQLPPKRVFFGTKVVKIDLVRHRVHTADGRYFDYDYLISTMPVKELITLTGQNQCKPAAERGLLHSSSNIIGIGLRGKTPPRLEKKCWMYFPEEDCPFYRVTVFSNYSPWNVPDSKVHWSLMCEVSESPLKVVDHRTLVDDVLQGLVNTGLVTNPNDIVSKWSYRADYGYPIPSLHRDEALAEIIPHFQRYGVFSRGRFGLWKYEVSNQDHSFMQGVEVVEHLLNGREEITGFHPDHANAVKHPWPFERWIKQTTAVSA